MMAGNPNWWSINTMHPQQSQQHLSSSSSSSSPSSSSASAYLHSSPPQYLYGSNISSSLSSTSLPDHHHCNQEFPRSWSHLLLGNGLANEQERFVSGPFQYKKLENCSWNDHQILNPSSNLRASVADVKQEAVAQATLLYSSLVDDEFQGSSNNIRPSSWSQVIMPASSPTSCVTSLNFSGHQADGRQHHHPDNSSECNSSSAGGVLKKPKIQHSSTQPVLKVRKEKLGDRITALHQLVSPFGKTDTASVLSEAIGYIRFLQAQIEALSSPYLGHESAGSMGRQQQPESQERPMDLRSRGLCLVPVSCTQHIGSENGADYWAPALGGGF